MISPRIRVHTGLKQTIYESIKVNEIVDKSFEVPGTYVQRYHGATHAMKNLSKVPRSLMDYLVDEMNMNNEITFIQHQKQEFIDFMKSDGSEPIQLSTVDNALQELKKIGLIQSVLRGTFHINPLYFTKGLNKKTRIDRVKQTINESFLENHKELFSKPE